MAYGLVMDFRWKKSEIKKKAKKKKKKEKGPGKKEQKRKKEYTAANTGQKGDCGRCGQSDMASSC